MPNRGKDNSYHYGGRGHVLKWVGGLFVPVAMDRIAVDVIDNFRKKNGLRTLTDSGRPAQYLNLASDLGLGIADRSRIHLETVTLPRFSRSAAQEKK